MTAKSYHKLINHIIIYLFHDHCKNAKKAPLALLPGLSRWIKSTLVASVQSWRRPKVVREISSELSSRLCSFPWRDHCPKQCLHFHGNKKCTTNEVILTFGDKQKRFNKPMNNFSKQHMFFLSGRKLAELATMEFLRGLGRERFAPTAASHNCQKSRFPNGFSHMVQGLIEYSIEVDVILPSLSESSVCIHRAKAF